MSLEEVLRFREKKALLQEKMIRENPGAVIVSLGMNIPGPVKSGPMIYAAFREGLERLEELSGKKKLPDMPQSASQKSRIHIR